MSRNKTTVTIGIDPSTTCCGIAIFRSGKLVRTTALKFKDTYDYHKLKNISLAFRKLFKGYEPDLVIIEEPFVFSVAGTRGISSLNQVAGAIFSEALNYTNEVILMHNSTVKKTLDLKGKDIKAIMMAKAKEFYDEEYETQDEADAVLLVEAYKKAYVDND